MTLAIFLDAGPLSELGHPTAGQGINEWATAMLSSGAILVIPAITDYEVRRELLRLNRRQSLSRLDSLTGVALFLPLTQPAMSLAAEYWAAVRRAGRPTADAAALDADAILAAQAATFRDDHPHEIVVATTNSRHISRFVPAANWPEITP